MMEKEKDKTKAQLLKELAKLHQQIAKLEKSETEHKQAEEKLRKYREYLEKLVEERTSALQKSEEQLRLVTDSLPVLISYIDSSERYRFNNKAYEEWFGHSREEVQGKHIREVLGNQAYRAIRKYVKTALSGQEVHFESKVPYKDAGLRYTEASYIPHIDDKRKVRGFFALVHNIAGQKRMDESLRESEEKYRTLFESTPEGILSSGPDERIMSANPASAEMLGYRNPEEVIGMPMVELYSDPESRKKLLSELMKKLYLKNYEVKIKRKDGVIRDLLANLKLIKDSNGDILRIDKTFSDITERKQAEEKLRETLKDLERSNKDLEQFAYVASHDLQEPLRMVASYVQLLARRYKGKLDSDADDFIAYAVEGAIRMQRMINDLLAYSRVETRGKEPKMTDYAYALGQAIANLHVAIEKSGAVVSNDDLPTINADQPQIVQLFQNLIDNSIKFRSKEQLRVHVGVKKKEKEWLFSVRDNGIGIDPQYGERIFVIFQRLHEKGKYPGTGIGLSVCKRIVERHGGRIWVESKSRKGSTFFFTIPRKGGK